MHRWLRTERWHRANSSKWKTLKKGHYSSWRMNKLQIRPEESLRVLISDVENRSHCLGRRNPIDYWRMLVECVAQLISFESTMRALFASSIRVNVPRSMEKPWNRAKLILGSGNFPIPSSIRTLALDPIRNEDTIMDMPWKFNFVYFHKSSILITRECVWMYAERWQNVGASCCSAFPNTSAVLTRSSFYWLAKNRETSSIYNYLFRGWALCPTTTVLPWRW